MEGVKPYGVGYGFILSGSGLVTAHPKPEILLKNYIDIQPGPERGSVWKAIKNGKAYSGYWVDSMTRAVAFQELVPITIGNTAEPCFFFGISIPESAIEKEVRQLYATIIPITVIALVLIAIVLWLISGSVAGPINRWWRGFGISQKVKET